MKRVCASLALLTAALPGATAVAQCPTPMVMTLSDGASERWDINEEGAIVAGTDGAFQGGLQLVIDGIVWDLETATTTIRFEPHRSGRGIAATLTIAVMSSSLPVERHIYASPTDGWVRYVDTFTNLSPDMPRTLTVEYRTNVGYDARSDTVTTADGDTMLEASDAYVVLDNELEIDDLGRPYETPPRPFCHIMFGGGARVRPMSLSGDSGLACGGMFGMDQSGLRSRWNVTVPPVSRVALMQFVAQRPNRADATASCAALSTLESAQFADLSDETLRGMLNWSLDRSNGSACATTADCMSGFCEDGVCCNAACGGAAADCQACSREAGAAMDGVCGTVAAGRACRPAAGPCDLDELCDGSATTCPPDALRALEMTCRPSAGMCDRAETCTGTNPACPPDRPLPRGWFCRMGIPGTCDFGARCDGTTNVCPPATIGNDDAPCDDMRPCTFAVCAGGACISSMMSCDDLDICTSDSCEGMACVNAYMPGCIGGRDAGPDVGELYPDAPEADGGDPFTDAGGGVDGSVEDGGSRMDAPRDVGPATLSVGGGGCVCRATRRPHAPPVLALALLGALVSRAARRRRSTPGSAGTSPTARKFDPPSRLTLLGLRTRGEGHCARRARALPADPTEQGRARPASDRPPRIPTTPNEVPGSHTRTALS